MHIQGDIIIVLYYGGYGTSQIGEWCLNHIHSMNNVEVINTSLLVSSTIGSDLWARKHFSYLLTVVYSLCVGGKETKIVR